MTELEPQFLEVVSTSALELRSALTPLQAGVVGATELKVSAGSGLSVDVALGIGFVRGSNVTDQGLYRVRNDATKNSASFDVSGIPANSSGFPRIDQVIARILDHTHDNSGLRKWRLEYVAGTGTSGATLDNRTGAVSDVGLGNNWLRLADALIPNGAVSVLAANIRDRRPWARGALNSITRNANAAAGSNYSTTSGALVAMDATNLNPRIECSGNPLRVEFHFMYSSSSAASYGFLQPRMDGNVFDGGALSGLLWVASVAAGHDGPMMQWLTTPAAGSHLFAPYFATEAAKTFTVYAAAATPFQMVVEELVRQNANNT